MFRAGLISGGDHPGKERVLLVHEVVWRVKLHQFTSVHNHNPGAPEHRVEAMGDGQEGAVREGGSQRRLDQSVALGVDASGRFVQDQDLGA